MNIAQIIPFVAVPAIIMLIASQLEKEHTYLKMLLFFFSFFGIFLIGAYVANPSSTTINTTFYKYCIGIVITFIGYVLIYFIYSSLNYLSELAKIRGWKK